MSTTGGVGGSGGAANTATSTSTGAATSTTTSTGTGAGSGGHTPHEAEENYEEHAREWATQDQQMNTDPKAYAAMYGSQAGNGNDSGLSAEEGSSTNTGHKGGA